jgi:hypothetical protein
VKRVIGLWISAVSALGCGELGDFFGPSHDVPKPVLDTSFAVSNEFAASGAMGDGADEELFAIFPPLGGQDACSGYLERRKDSAGRAPAGACYRFEYLSNGTDNWAGVYWQWPANNWGQEKGRRISPDTFDSLRFKVALMQENEDGELEAAASRMTFWAGGMGHGPSAAALALEAQGRAAALDAGVPLIDGGEPMLTDLLYKDAFKTAELVRPVLPDRDTGEATWNEFSLRIPRTTTLPNDPDDPLRDNEPQFGEPYQRVIGAFAWALGHPAGELPGTGKKFLVFIDDIVWQAAAAE